MASYKLGTAYFGNRIQRHVIEDMKDIKKHSCDWVLHTFDETDLRFNRKNLKEMTRLSHAQGLKVYYSPWAIGGIFGGEAVSAFVANHPEACQVLSTGERTPHACPRQPEFRRFMKTWIEACVEAGGDVLFWDEPHLWIPAWEGRKEKDTEFSCFCQVCQSDFKRRYKKNMPRIKTDQVRAFRIDTVQGFLTWAMKTSKKLKPSIKNAVCLLPFVGEHWPNPAFEKTAANPLVDIVATDPYWNWMITAPQNPAKGKMEGFVDTMSERMADLGKRHKKEVQVWVQLFGHRKQDEPEITKAIEMIAAAGIKNIGAWGYEGCGSFSKIASHRPRVVWDRLGRDYAKLKKKK